MMLAAMSVAIAFGATVLFTGAVLAWLRRRAILDHPNERSSHQTPTPRGGGLAVVPVVLVLWAAIAAAEHAPLTEWAIVAVATVLMVFTWLDDLRGLPAGLRLLAHVAAALAGIATIPAAVFVFQGLLPLWADRGLAILAWVWFINLFNFMDGIDGLTGTETASIGIGLAVVALVAHEGVAVEPLVLAGAALGFLVWNRHPARIFLGDVGSVPLGFLLGGLLIAEALRGLWAPALILPAYYLADATITLVARLLAGEKIWQAHRRHFYQLALRNGATHGQVVRWIALANLALIVLAAHAVAAPVEGLIGAALVVSLLLFQLRRMGLAKG